MTFKEKMKSFAAGSAAGIAAIGIPLGTVLGFTALLAAASPPVAGLGFMAELFLGAALGIKISRSGWNSHKKSFVTGLAAASVALVGVGYRYQEPVKTWPNDVKKGKLEKAFVAAASPLAAPAVVSARPQPALAVALQR